MFYERLERLCAEKGLTVPQVCKEAGLHRSTHTVWRAGHKPSSQSVVQLARVLCTTPEYLLCGVEEMPSLEEPYVRDILDVVVRLPVEARARLLGTLQTAGAPNSL